MRPATGSAEAIVLAGFLALWTLLAGLALWLELDAKLIIGFWYGWMVVNSIMAIAGDKNR